MTEALWKAERSRRIVERVSIQFDLELKSPTHFGAGSGDDIVDMPLLLDTQTDRPLLPGTTLTGALREYLQVVEKGCRSGKTGRLTRRLFGGHRNLEAQSAVLIDDSVAVAFDYERRAGVVIQSDSGTAEEGKLFDFGVWVEGTVFPVRMELVIVDANDGIESDTLIGALGTALKGLENGDIRFGLRKSRGFGQVKAKNWRLKRYKMSDPADFIRWLSDDSMQPDDGLKGGDWKSVFGTFPMVRDHREWLKISFYATLDDSIMVRGLVTDLSEPDITHIKTGDRPFIPGSSLAGVMRQRSELILDALGFDGAGRRKRIAALFGSAPEEPGPLVASRVIVSDAAITAATSDLVQNRVAIDRFTGGALDTALFNEQPVFATGNTSIHFDIRLINPSDADIGLLMLILKDLWTGDLWIGGESSIGRGRLEGRRARIALHRGNDKTHWEIETGKDDNRLRITGDAGKLESFVSALRKTDTGKEDDA